MPERCSPVSFAKLHSSIPCTASQSSPPKGMPGLLKRAKPSENGCAANPNPPASRTARAIPHASRPRWRMTESMPNAR
jgi:hypothetical protein